MDISPKDFLQEKIDSGEIGIGTGQTITKYVESLQTEIDGLKEGRKIASVDDAQGLINQIKIRDIKITALEDVVEALAKLAGRAARCENCNEPETNHSKYCQMHPDNEVVICPKCEGKGGICMFCCNGSVLKRELIKMQESSPASPQSEYQQLDEVNNRIELEKDNWTLRFKCCDCGLVHKMAFAIEDNGNLGIAIDSENPTPYPTAIRYTCSHCDVSVRVKILALTPKIIVDSTLLCKNCGKPFTHHRLEFN